MALADPIQLRLSIEKKLQYEAQAAGVGKPLGTYLRDRLEQEDLMLDELQMLRRAVERVADGGKGNGLGEAPSVLLELLLTMRQLAGPGKSDLAQKEIERIGYTTWSPKK